MYCQTYARIVTSVPSSPLKAPLVHHPLSLITARWRVQATLPLSLSLANPAIGVSLQIPNCVSRSPISNQISNEISFRSLGLAILFFLLQPLEHHQSFSSGYETLEGNRGRNRSTNNLFGREKKSSVGKASTETPRIVVRGGQVCGRR